MKLVPSRPVTIHAVRHAQRWFPAIYRHTDGSMLLYIENGYDAEYAPFGRWRSLDGGRTWHEEEENIPRGQIVHSFADNTLFELDPQGYLDPASPSTFCYYGAWSVPSQPKTNDIGHSAFYHGNNQLGEEWLPETTPATGNVGRGIFRVYAPSIAPTPLPQGGHAYPSFPWWPLINRLHGSDAKAADIFVGGPYITDTLEVDGQLLGIGYGLHRDDSNSGLSAATLSSIFLYASSDRGRTWKEISTVARGTTATSEGFNEATLIALRDGRLHSVFRSGDVLFQAWSADNGQSWTQPSPISLIDSDITPRMVWPRCVRLEDGTLVLAYGRPGKHLIFDPTGTGEQWQGHLDLHAWELDTQELMGVPEELRLRGDTNNCVRYWDSSDYLTVIAIGPREMLVTYDVQNYMEHWNSVPVAGVRMLRVSLVD